MLRVGDSGTLTGGEASIASAATINLGGVKTRNVAITGTTAITSFGSGANREALIRFTGALTLTHNATSLVLPGATNIITAAGDTCLATSDAAGNWRVRQYTRAADGNGGGWTPYTPTLRANSGTFTAASANGRWQQRGKRVDVWVNILITTNGTAAGQVYATLPSTPANPFILFGREVNVTAKPVITTASGAEMQITYLDFSYPGGDGTRIILNGSYEAQ